jgi:uncharacterized protein YndB with AHSA1/START domain
MTTDQPTTASTDTISTADREIVITRLFDAPRQIVFDVWTDPEHIGQWWGPNGFTTTTHQMDVRPGGVWRFIMHGPDGTDYKNRIIYIEVAEPERLVFWHDGDEGDENQAFHVTVTFDEEEGKTRLTMRSVFNTVEEFEQVKKFGAVEGGNQTLGRLAEYLTTM